jgi:beta-mannanase
MYYPGDDYVDIVALDVYVDDPVLYLNLVFFV